MKTREQSSACWPHWFLSSLETTPGILSVKGRMSGASREPWVFLLLPALGNGEEMLRQILQNADGVSPQMCHRLAYGRRRVNEAIPPVWLLSSHGQPLVRKPKKHTPPGPMSSRHCAGTCKRAQPYTHCRHQTINQSLKLLLIM